MNNKNKLKYCASDRGLVAVQKKKKNTMEILDCVYINTYLHLIYSI